MTLSPSTVSPLPQYWPYGRYRGRAIHILPTRYLYWALRCPDLAPGLRAALRAEEGLRQLERDQQEGY